MGHTDLSIFGAQKTIRDCLWAKENLDPKTSTRSTKIQNKYWDYTLAGNLIHNMRLERRAKDENK